MILACVCNHEYQDTRYGLKQRVHNPCAKKPSLPRQYRCTVCERVRAKQETKS